MKVEPTPTQNPQRQIEAIQLLTNPQMQSLFQKINSEYQHQKQLHFYAELQKLHQMEEAKY